MKLRLFEARVLAVALLGIVGALSQLVLARSPQLDASSPRRVGQAFTITNDGDFGPGTLRQAILDSNATPGADTLTFGIGSGSKTIRVSVPLPEITDAVTVDGSTQPGFSGKPIVEIDGTAAGEAVDGFAISAGGTTIRGLVINGFSGAGIRIRTLGDNRIVGCYLGTDAAGASARPNGTGIAIDASAGNVIGGANAADRNVISGNSDSGVAIAGDPNATFSEAHDNAVIGNYIGTNAAGTALVSNGGAGIHTNRAFRTTIGGSTAGAMNVISGNEYHGIIIENSSDPGSTAESFNTVQGNRIGTDVSGVRAIPNLGSGVFVKRFGRIIIGGRSAGEGNRIAFNRGVGIHCSEPVGMQVYSNEMFGNESGGIYYDGASFAPMPSLSRVDVLDGQIRIVGAAQVQRAAYPVVIQFFVSDVCAEDDQSQGERLLGERDLVADTGGLVTFDETFAGSCPEAGGVTATLTNLTFRATSSFSPCSSDTHGCERPFVTGPRAAQSVRYGQPATLTVDATGTEPFTWRWYVNTSTGENPIIPGATTNTYVTAPVTETKNYIVTIENACGMKTAYPGVIPCTAKPEFVTQPADQFVPAGESAVLRVDYNLLAASRIQWYRGQGGDTSDPIDGAVSSGLVVTGTDAVGSFWARLSNACGFTDSLTARVGPGPSIRSIALVTSASGGTQLVIKGSGFMNDARVYVGQIGFEAPAKVTKNRVVKQSGKLQNGLSLKKAFPRGEAVTVFVYNGSGYQSSGVYTRR
ncbi:MAG: IPT/TIG domain-containing protein [Acidobacteria bacterium]|nr:IPT/TIG domain-containing protein [Acidobacteriota bacterium]